MTNMVEIGQNNFESSLNKSGDIARRPMDRVKRWLAAAAAGTVLATGAGVAQEARAEEPTPTVDNPTKIEAEVNSSEVSNDGMPQLPEDNLSESTTNTAEGQITAKGGVGDLLANADEGVVTNFKAGGEVPDNDGGEVQYASNVTNENGEPVIVPLEGSGSGEFEKSQEQMIIENINDYLNIGEKYSDENIKNILIKSKVEKTKDLGLIHSRNVQGILLGYFGDNNSDNIIVFFGTKGPKLERLVTVVKIPFYVINDVSAPLKFSLLGSNSTLDDGNGRSTKNGNEILSVLDSQNGRVIIVGMYTDKITDELVKRAAGYNSKSENRYVQDLKDSTYPSRSLGGMVYRNGIQDFEYNEKVNLWKIYSGADTDEVKQFCSLVCSSDTKNIPITVDLTYLSQ